MYDKKLDEFLDGDLHPGQRKLDLTEGSIEKEFFISFKKLIEDNNSEVPEFNPFEKIENVRKKRISIAKRILPYAATVIILLGFFMVYQNNFSKKSKTAYSNQEILEIKKNTEMALLYFSKELNACMAKFEDAKQLQQPANEIRQLKDLKIEKDNTLENIKFN